MNSDIQKVEVYITMSGDYCSFNEASICMVYDITNDKANPEFEYTKEELESWNFKTSGHGYTDVEKRDALKVGDNYYIKF